MSRTNFLCKISNTCHCANYVLLPRKKSFFFANKQKICKEMCYFKSKHISKNQIENKTKLFNLLISSNDNDKYKEIKKDVIYDKQIPLL